MFFVIVMVVFGLTALISFGSFIFSSCSIFFMTSAVYFVQMIGAL